MNLARIAAAPIIVEAGGFTFLLSPPTLRDLGLILRALEAHDPPLVLGSDASIDYFTKVPGMALLLWVATHKDRDWDLDDALGYVTSMANPEDEDDLARLIAAVIREVLTRGAAEGDNPTDGSSTSTPLDSIDFGELINRAELRGFDPVTVSGWTIDQLVAKFATPGEDVVDLDTFYRLAADPRFQADRAARRAIDDADEMGQPQNTN